MYGPVAHRGYPKGETGPADCREGGALQAGEGGFWDQGSGGRRIDNDEEVLECDGDLGGMAGEKMGSIDHFRPPINFRPRARMVFLWLGGC
jgi:hypothetical protein